MTVYGSGTDHLELALFWSDGTVTESRWNAHGGVK